MDAKSLFLTANADTIYFWVNLDVTNGPIVVETPPMSLGVVDDMWFQWITDFGLPGPDRGEGGKYLFVPPDYKGELPERRLLRPEDAHDPRHLARAILSREERPEAGRRADQEDAQGLSLPSRRIRHEHRRWHWRARRRSARTPDHKLDWAFLRPEEPVKFTEGTGKVMNTVPPSDFSYFEMLNDRGAEGARRARSTRRSWDRSPPSAS